MFGGCINLKQLTIESPHFKLVNNLILSADLVNLFGALHISNDTLDIPPSVEHIAPNAFWGMKCVKHLIFSNDLKTLGYSAFKRSEFTSVHFNSVIDKVPNECFCFATIHNLTLNGISNIAENAFLCAKIGFQNVISIKGNLDKLAFCLCKGIKRIELHDCEVIEASAFSGSSIESIHIKSPIVSIGENAFYCCANLSTVDFEKGIQRISKYAFLGCRSLERINLNGSEPDLEDRTFCNCQKLKSFGNMDHSIAGFIDSLCINDNCMTCGICEGIAKYSLISSQSPYPNFENVCGDIIKKFEEILNNRSTSSIEQFKRKLSEYLQIVKKYGFPKRSIPRNTLTIGRAAFIFATHVSAKEIKYIHLITAASEFASILLYDYNSKDEKALAAAILFYILLSDKYYLLKLITNNLKDLPLDFHDLSLTLCEYLFGVAFNLDNENKCYIPLFNGFIGFDFRDIFRIRYELFQLSPFSSDFSKSIGFSQEAFRNIFKRVAHCLITESIESRIKDFDDFLKY